MQRYTLSAENGGRISMRGKRGIKIHQSIKSDTCIFWLAGSKPNALYVRVEILGKMKGVKITFSPYCFTSKLLKPWANGEK